MIARPVAPRRGVTLLEVLLSVGIFFLAMTALVRLLDIGTDAALDATFQADGNRLAQSKLAEVEAGVLAPDADASGTFDSEPAWSWQTSSSAGGAPNLYTVTVTVSRTTGKATTVAHTQIIFDSRQMGKSGEIANPVTNTATVGATP